MSLIPATLYVHVMSDRGATFEIGVMGTADREWYTLNVRDGAGAEAVALFLSADDITRLETVLADFATRHLNPKLADALLGTDPDDPGPEPEEPAEPYPPIPLGMEPAE